MSDVADTVTEGAGRGLPHVGFPGGLRHHHQDVGHHLECLRAGAVDHRWDAAGHLGDGHQWRGMRHDDDLRLHDDEAAVHDLDDRGPHPDDGHGTNWFCLFYRTFGSYFLNLT